MFGRSIGRRLTASRPFLRSLGFCDVSERSEVFEVNDIFKIIQDYQFS